MFLEGGVTWGCSVYNDLVGHWKARNPQGAGAGQSRPTWTATKLAELIQRYGHPLMREVTRGKELELNDVVPAPADLNDYRRCGIETVEEIRDLFVPHFYFGCEAEDPMIHTAFNTRANAFGARLNAVLGSDIGHWDVAEMAAILEESYELVEHGIISEPRTARLHLHQSGGIPDRDESGFLQGHRGAKRGRKSDRGKSEHQT